MSTNLKATNRQVIALIPAAGSSVRMGCATSKLLLEVAGQTILQRTVNQILSSNYIQKVVIMVRDVDLDEVRAMRYESLNSKEIEVIVGGATRQESVRRGLSHVRLSQSDTKSLFVLVHDGARCFVDTTLIDECIEKAFQHNAVTAALPLADSIKKVGSERFVEVTLEREGVWLIQTPQVFSFNLLQQAHEKAHLGATDDATLVENLAPVYVVEGQRMNFKITTPEDLEIARRLLSTI